MRLQGYTLEEVAEVPESHTGSFLRHSLKLEGEPAGAHEAIARAAKANGTAAVKKATAAAAKPRSTRGRAKATV